MKTIQFKAPEYQADASFQTVRYQFSGSNQSGWEIEREGSLLESLGPGFDLIETQYCGVCSTDLARRFLPYPLPQIIGHEVVGQFEGNTVVPEINASHFTRDHGVASCPFCSEGLPTHCPDRITLGINRLPGGFAPYLLAPTNGLHPIPDSISAEAACFVEPLAAAQHAVSTTPPQTGDRVAVLGPRKLGSLIILALSHYRTTSNIDFEIVGIIRHEHLKAISQEMGSDKTIVLDSDSNLKNAQFDIVYDTTGSPQGFESALNLTRRIVHLKSTNGQTVLGMRHLTEMVVDEIVLLPYSEVNLAKSQHHAIVSNLKEADDAIMTSRPKSNILLRANSTTSGDSPLYDAITKRNIEIHSSRCGDFTKAIDMLSSDNTIPNRISEFLISHRFPLHEIPKAFETAHRSDAVKIVVQTTF